jgi:hypothetical protein
MNKLVAGVVLVVAVGCSKKDGGETKDKDVVKDDKGGSAAMVVEPKGSGSATPAAGSADKPPATPAMATIKVDPEIEKRIKDIVTNCKVDFDSSQIYDCKAKEEDEVFKYIFEKKPDNGFESLTEIAVTQGAKDNKYVVAVVKTWPGFRDRELTKKLSTAAAADRIIKMIPMLPPKGRGFGGLSIPLIAGKRAELTAALTKLPPESQVKHSAIRDYLDWGGIAALPDVQAFYKAATTEDERSAATSAVDAAMLSPMQASMGMQKEISAADKTAMCDWVKSIAADPAAPPGGFSGALESLAACKDAYIDDALNAIEARIKTEKLTDTTTDKLHHMCWAEGMVGGSPNGTPAQCERAFSILAAAVVDKDLKPGVVRQGLWVVEMLAENAPDLKKKAKPLLSKFTGAKDKEVKDQAKESLGKLK